MKTKMWPLPAEDLFMVGRATLLKLNKLNIFTIGDLANYDLEILNKKWNGEPVRHMGIHVTQLCTNEFYQYFNNVKFVIGS